MICACHLKKEFKLFQKGPNKDAKNVSSSPWDEKGRNTALPSTLSQKVQVPIFQILRPTKYLCRKHFKAKVYPQEYMDPLGILVAVKDFKLSYHNSGAIFCILYP